MFSNQHIATMGIEYFKKNLLIEDHKINLKIWDTAGQEQYRSITRNFYKNSNGVIVAYDVTDRESFEKVQYWIEKVKENTADNIKMILIGNKIDLLRSVSTEEGRFLAKEHNIPFFETSAKENLGINEAIESLVYDVVKDYIEERTRTSSTQCGSHNGFGLKTESLEKTEKQQNTCGC